MIMVFSSCRSSFPRLIASSQKIEDDRKMNDKNMDQ